MFDGACVKICAGTGIGAADSSDSESETESRRGVNVGGQGESVG